jgi:Hemin uptake protein
MGVNKSDRNHDAAQPAIASQAPRRVSDVNTHFSSGSSNSLRETGNRDCNGQEPAVRTINSEELFRGTAEIAIKHAGAFYRLKITKQGKLILNK